MNAATCSKRTSLGPTRVHDMMANETWLTANEAKRLNFCDEIVETPAIQNAAQTEATADMLANVRAEMKAEKDPARIASLSRMARVLRGHGNLFAEPELESRRE